MNQRIAQLDVVCGGKPREFGEQLGDGLRERILAASNSLNEFEPFRDQRPWWLPFDWYKHWSERWAMGALRPPIKATFPHIGERIEGMANGAGVRLSMLYLFHAFESLAISPTVSVTSSPLAGCSAVGVPRTSAADGMAFLAHNLDGVDLLGDLLVVRENLNEGRFRSIGLSCAPLSGMVDGVNEHGLAITYDWAFATDADGPAAPVSVAIDDALANCRCVDEAIRFITARRRHGGAMLMMADDSGEVAALELSHRRFSVRRSPRERPLFHSNQYRSRSMQRAQVSRNAAYAGSVPQALLGRRVLESAERRDHELHQLLRSRRRLDPDSMTRLLSHHGSDGAASDDTICMHGTHWTTQANIQLMPRRRAIRVSYGPTCTAHHQEFQL